MRNKHSQLTNAYCFMSEAIILFLLCLPFLHAIYDFKPYWSYLGMVGFMCALFTLYTRTNHQAIYILTAPIFMVIAWWIGLPIFFCIVIPILLTWRYILLREGKVEYTEVNYIVSTVMLTVVLVFWIKDIEIVLYAAFLFLIIIIGYLLSHLLVIEKEDQKQFQTRTWLYLLGISSAVGIIIYFLFDILRGLMAQVWFILQSIFLFVIREVSRLILPFLDFEISPGEQPELEGEVDGDYNDLIGNLEPSQLPNFLPYIIWGVLIILGIIAIFIVMRLMKRKFTPEETEEISSESVTYEQLTGKTKEERKSFSERMRKMFRGSMHPARKAVLHFERFAKKQGLGRQSSETIEEWLKRIEVNTDIGIYQRVRYGDMEISEEELQQLKDELTEMETRLKQNEA